MHKYIPLFLTYWATTHITQTFVLKCKKNVFCIIQGKSCIIQSCIIFSNIFFYGRIWASWLTTELPLITTASFSKVFCFKLMFFHQFTRNVSIENKFTVSMPIFACENNVKVLQFPCDAGFFARWSTFFLYSQRKPGCLKLSKFCFGNRYLKMRLR